MQPIYHQFKRKFQRYWLTSCLSAALVILGFIPIRLAIATATAPQPQAILVLGGGMDREAFAAQFAHSHPKLEIWVSSGTTVDRAQAIFRNAGIADQRVRLDYRAKDTVTNFTTLVNDFERQNIRHIYLVTSDFHMRRATAIATLVLGSRGIAFTPVAIPSPKPNESIVRVLRDGGRSLLWLATGRTGASLGAYLAD